MFQCKTNPYILRAPAYPWLLDSAGFVRAGHVLKLIDISGSEVALKHLNQHGERNLVVTASLDRTNFKQPIRLWEMIRLESQITQVWNTSMEVQVKVMADSIVERESRDIATAYLVFVGLDPKTRTRIGFPSYKPRSLEDRRLAKAADLRKKNRSAEGKTAPFIPIDSSDQPIVISRHMTEKDANAQSNVFGGIILSLIDEGGSLAARRQALDGPVTGVQQDRMSFIAPTFIGETVEVKSIITKTWNTSMEVQVEVDAINPNTQQRRRVASSYVVYVRLGPSGRPSEVPPWAPTTDLQKQRAELADIRRTFRLQEESHTRALEESSPPRFLLSELLQKIKSHF